MQPPAVACWSNSREPSIGLRRAARHADADRACITGEDVLRPVLDAFMSEYPTVSARLYLLDRPVNLIDEGIDVALRIAAIRGIPVSSRSASAKCVA